jgi:uncharacterized integral membrane protein
MFYVSNTFSGFLVFVLDLFIISSILLGIFIIINKNPINFVYISLCWSSINNIIIGVKYGLCNGNCTGYIRIKN